MEPAKHLTEISEKPAKTIVCPDALEDCADAQEAKGEGTSEPLVFG